MKKLDYVDTSKKNKPAAIENWQEKLAKGQQHKVLSKVDKAADYFINRVKNKLAKKMQTGFNERLPVCEKTFYISNNDVEVTWGHYTRLCPFALMKKLKREFAALGLSVVIDAGYRPTERSGTTYKKVPKNHRFNFKTYDYMFDFKVFIPSLPQNKAAEASLLIA